MPCYIPQTVYQSISLRDDGTKFPFSFLIKDGYEAIQIPCRKCSGCRLERSRQWAIRIMHEASLYSDNCFITLTYSDDFLPSDKGLQLKHWQDFMKRFRKSHKGLSAVPTDEKIIYPIRFYHCGEYGELNLRPHYHACIFNFDFDDKEPVEKRHGHILYKSDKLSKLWKFGYASVGSLTFQSAAYVARYVMKKQIGGFDHIDTPEAASLREKLSYDPSCPFWKDYIEFDSSSGEVNFRKTEYATMSRKPGIASRWFDLYKDEVFPSDSVIVNGFAQLPPKFYTNRLKSINPFLHDDIITKRLARAEKNAWNSTPERLSIRHQVRQASNSLLIRDL